MRKISLLFVLIVTCFQVFAIDPFTLKGKTIIIPPCVLGYKIDSTDKIYSYQGFDNVYSEKVLKKNQFVEKSKVQIDIYGHELFVEDVFFIDKQDQNRAVCLVVLFEEKKYVLRFPLFEPPVLRTGDVYYYDYDSKSFLGDLAVGSSDFIVDYYGHSKQVESKLFDPHSLQLIVYEADQIQFVDKTYKGTSVFILSESASKKASQIKWKFDGVFLPWENTDFDYYSFAPSNTRFQFESYYIRHNYVINNYKKQQSLILMAFKHDDREYYLDIDTDSPPVFEDDYYNQCRLRNNSPYVYELKREFEKQKVHITTKNNTSLPFYSIDSHGEIRSGFVKSGCYFFDRVELCYTNSDDSLYFSFHGVLREIDSNGEGEKELFCPINCFKLVTIELDSIYHERLLLQEQEQRRAREARMLEEQQEKAEYHKMLVKKYGKTNAKLIEEGEVRIGFTKEMCIEAWGEPEHINTTTTANGKTEQWVYGWFSYLYFKGNKLIAIQDQE